MAVLTETANTPEAWTGRAALAATSWEAAGWTLAGQNERFRAVLAALDPQPGESLLDFGCGTGRLADFRLTTDGDYLGFDTSPGMIARARAEHPSLTFTVSEPTRHFDLTAVIGTFNLPGDKQLTWATLRRLWDRTGRALAVSLYAGDDERCLSYTLDEVSRFGRSESYYARAERWRHNDILLLLERSR